MEVLGKKINQKRVPLSPLLGSKYCQSGRDDGFPSLEVFKARLDGIWGNLIYWEVSLSMAGGLEQEVV